MKWIKRGPKSILHLLSLCVLVLSNKIIPKIIDIYELNIHKIRLKSSSLYHYFVSCNMMNDFLTSLQDYLNAHSYENSRTKDLWDALTKVGNCTFFLLPYVIQQLYFCHKHFETSNKPDKTLFYYFSVNYVYYLPGF